MPCWWTKTAPSPPPTSVDRIGGEIERTASLTHPLTAFTSPLTCTSVPPMQPTAARASCVSSAGSKTARAAITRKKGPPPKSTWSETSSIFGTSTSTPFPKAEHAARRHRRISRWRNSVHYHTGNHDLWTYEYLEEELGVQLHRDPIVRDFDGLTCMIGHGDGLGPVIMATNASKSLHFSLSGLSVGFTRPRHPAGGLLTKDSRAKGGKKTRRSKHPKTNGSGPTARIS